MLEPDIDIDRVSIQLLSFVTTVVLGHVDCQEVEGPYCRGQSQRAVSRCVEAAAPAVSAAQDRGEDRLRSETSARRHGGWVAALLSYTPHTYPHPRCLLVSWYWGHVQHDPCEGRPSVCSGARKAVVLLMVKRRSEGSCACGRHTATPQHIYIYLQHSMLRLKLDIL